MQWRGETDDKTFFNDLVPNQGTPTAYFYVDLNKRLQ
jgi:hypothetical protein